MGEVALSRALAAYSAYPALYLLRVYCLGTYCLWTSFVGVRVCLADTRNKWVDGGSQHGVIVFHLRCSTCHCLVNFVLPSTCC